MLQSQSVSSPDTVRWQRALDRSLANALDVLIEPISGEAFVESATNPGTLYQVTATSCTCPAGQAGIPCQHRACYLAQIGELPLEAASLPVENCPECHGCGVRYSRDYERAGGPYPTCKTCKGTGMQAPRRPTDVVVLFPDAAA